MTLARWGLAIAAVVFLGVGMAFLAQPVPWAAIVEIQLPTPMARTDFRATYGGFDFGIGIFMVLGTLRPDWTRAALLVLALSTAGYGGGRLTGILLDRAPNPLMIGLTGLEITTAVVAFVVFRGLAKSTNPGGPVR